MSFFGLEYQSTIHSGFRQSKVQTKDEGDIQVKNFAEKISHDPATSILTN
jgi:hypothetical protein